MSENNVRKRSGLVGEKLVRIRDLINVIYECNKTYEMLTGRTNIIMT